MTGYRPGLYWQMTWRYIGPAMMSVLLVASVISMIRTSPEYGAWDPIEVRHLTDLSRRDELNSSVFHEKGATVMKPYPSWVMTIALGMICAGILPMPLVYLLRRFQILKVDLDIHQGSIRRNETTASTKEMIDQDDDVSRTLCVCITDVEKSIKSFRLKVRSHKQLFD